MIDTDGTGRYVVHYDAAGRAGMAAARNTVTRCGRHPRDVRGLRRVRPIVTVLVVAGIATVVIRYALG